MAGLGAVEENRLADQYYLNENEIREMMKNGLTIGAHGHEHWCMTSLNSDQTRAEIVTCKEFINRHFGCTPACFCPSYGKANQWADDIVRQHGFRAICTTEPGLVDRKADSYSLPRLMIGGELINFETSLSKLYLKN